MERCFSRCAYIAIQDGEPLTIIQRAWSFEIESFISQICGKAFLWGGVHILILSAEKHPFVFQCHVCQLVSAKTRKCRLLGLAVSAIMLLRIGHREGREHCVDARKWADGGSS